MDEVEVFGAEVAAGARAGYRVVRLGEPLRQALRSRREATGQTVRAFLAEAVEHELPALVAALGELEISAEVGSAGRPARLPLSAGGLAALRTAAETLGLPASLLLRASLARLARRKRRRPGPGPGAQAEGAGARRSDRPGRRVEGGAKAKTPLSGRRPVRTPTSDGLARPGEREGVEEIAEEG